MLEKIKATANYIKERINATPEVGIILGTGLGGLVKEIEIKESIPYSEIPNFPVSTVDGHAGRLIYGTLGNREVLAMQGRFHYYEGYSMKEVTFPVRVLKSVGISHLFVSNASGGLNPDWHVGEIVIISDHINFFPEHPLRGKNESELGPRWRVVIQSIRRPGEKPGSQGLVRSGHGRGYGSRYPELPPFTF